jgi:hypothetical protein
MNADEPSRDQTVEFAFSELLDSRLRGNDVLFVSAFRVTRHESRVTCR